MFCPRMRISYLKIALISTLVWPCQFAFGQESVCLYDSTSVKINKDLTSDITIKQSYLIGNESESRFSEIIISLNNFINVTSVRGYILNTNGSRKIITESDIRILDLSDLRGESNKRIMTVSIASAGPGSSVYLQYTIMVRNLLYLPRFGGPTPLLTNQYIIELEWPEKLPVRYDYRGIEISTQKNPIWFTIENLTPENSEPNPCSAEPYLLISSDRFAFGGIKYDSKTWMDVGSFYAQLSGKTLNSTDDIDKLVERLCRESKGPMDSLQALFRFVSDSIEYVPIQLTRNDFRPNDCSAILQNRYGDCKDQSALLCALLNFAGFRSYPALVYTGETLPIDKLPPWPSWFDHVIVAVERYDSYFYLDPGDSESKVNFLPPRLINKFLLVCDGISDLKRANPYIQPAIDISWEFEIFDINADSLVANFNIEMWHLGKALYSAPFGQLGQGLFSPEILEYPFKATEWTNPGMYIGLTTGGLGVQMFGVSGNIWSKAFERNSENLVIVPSPLNYFLLAQIFNSTRDNDYCNPNSYILKERIVVNSSPDHFIAGFEGYSLEKSKLIYVDSAINIGAQAKFVSYFRYDGGPIPASDFNQLRQYLLNRNRQRYVRFDR